MLSFTGDHLSRLLELVQPHLRMGKEPGEEPPG